MRRATLGSLAGMFLALVAVGTILAGCRENVGGECLSDSDCQMDLVCMKMTETVEGKSYEQKWGTCLVDTDSDTIPDDGGNSGSSVDYRCGIHAYVDTVSGVERVFEKITADCDDNCPTVANSTILRRFACKAKDDCCPIAEEEKGQAKFWELCSDITPDPSTCEACFNEQNIHPSTCYNGFPGVGYNVDELGCVVCQPLKKRIPCSKDEECQTIVKSPCAETDLTCLIKPACSGYWACDESQALCVFAPMMVPEESGGADVLYQMDSDWDGIGDACDNCPLAANGIECNTEGFAKNCDINGDGVVTPEEKELGNQYDKDLDGIGDACDLCLNFASIINTDLDKDRIGDPCDPDQDGDRICDPGDTTTLTKPCHGSDNCLLLQNEDQKDTDIDGIGDICDPDLDGDGIREDGDGSRVIHDHPCADQVTRGCDDNCPAIANSDQADTDGDGWGDACDP